MIFKIGEEKGFYKEDGLRVLPITTSSQAGIQGLLAGALILVKFPYKAQHLFQGMHLSKSYTTGFYA